MPPKQKFTREEMIACALSIVREDGISALTARSLGAKLGSSSRPVFTVFRNMDEVRGEVLTAARQIYNGYVRKGLASVPAFKGVGMQYVQFAIGEPKLFQLLFMAEQEEPLSLSGVLSVIDSNHAEIQNAAGQQYGLSSGAAERLYQHLWIYTHGIAVLCATGVCHFSEDEINQMITEICISLIQKMKAGEEP